MKIGLAMKMGLSFVLLAVWIDVCEADPSKGEGEDTFATKKEVEEQKAALAKLRQELREEFRKQLKEEVSKEKVANSKLRRADADILKVEKEMREIDKEEEKQHADLRKRQNDVLDETKKLIRAEINSEATKSIIRAEIDAHKNCQSGRDEWTANLGDNSGSKVSTVNFNPAFSRKPLVIASFNYVRNLERVLTTRFQIQVSEVSPTKMKLTHSGYGIYAQSVYWLACQ